MTFVSETSREGGFGQNERECELKKRTDYRGCGGGGEEDCRSVQSGQEQEVTCSRDFAERRGEERRVRNPRHVARGTTLKSQTSSNREANSFVFAG